MTSFAGISGKRKAWIAAPLLVLAGGYAASCSESGNSAEPAQTDFTAGVVMTKMESQQRVAFVAGVVEGLAHARYMRDGKSTTGRSCIYGWFYDKQDRIDEIFEAFNRYPDALPGHVVGTLAATECGA